MREGCGIRVGPEKFFGQGRREVEKVRGDDRKTNDTRHPHLSTFLQAFRPRKMGKSGQGLWQRSAHGFGCRYGFAKIAQHALMEPNKCEQKEL